MSWVNLDDVYVNKTGDTIAGDLSVGGTLKVNDGKGKNTTYNVANEITTLRDSVSQDDTLVLYNDSWQYVRIHRVGHMCVLTWAISQSTAAYWAINNVIPERLRPDKEIYAPSCVTDVKGYMLNVCAYCYIHYDGTIGFQVAAATSGAVNRGICSWYIN